MSAPRQLWPKLQNIRAIAAQMDWARGLRAGVALCVPLVLGDLAGIPDLGWAALGGFEAILADTGGPYRSRMASLATLSLGGAAGLFLGSIAGGHLVWALPTTILFCFLWSYLGVLGQPFSSAGLLVQVIFICGIGAPTHNWREAMTHALLLLAGGAWAALLSLLLWPLDAYRPARFAVAACYEELASFLTSITELATRAESSADHPQMPRAPSIPWPLTEWAGNLEPDPAPRRTPRRPALWHRLAKHHQYRIRRAVETGWQAVASIRAERQAETAQGNQLVVLLEHADLLIPRTIALAELLESQAGEEGSGCDDRALVSLADLRQAELYIAQLLLRRGQTAAEAQARRLELQRLPEFLESCLGASESSQAESNQSRSSQIESSRAKSSRAKSSQASAATRFLLAQVAQAASLLDAAIESASLLRLGRAPAFRSNSPTSGTAKKGSVSQFAYVYARLAELRQDWNLTRILDQLRANFTRKSLLLRHAARVALVCGLDVTIILGLNINHGYWLLMTSLIVLQPHVSGTMRRGLERIGGTVGGGILAAVLAVLLHSQLAIAAVLFPLALLSIAILPVSYAAFAFFLTPAFVLAWLPFSGDWQLALVRTGNTIAGALISVLAMAFLFPIYERDRAADFLRASLAADRRYLEQLAESWRARSASTRLLANARRAAGLAHNDTEESLERLLAESWPRRRPFAQFVAAFVTYLRRFAQSVTALTALDGEWEWKLSTSTQVRLALLDRQLEWLEDQTTPDPASAPWPHSIAAADLSGGPPATPPIDHPGERQMERLERQADVLHRQLRTLREHGWIPGARTP
jgi:uncharacterized membrane protein YccC